MFLHLSTCGHLQLSLLAGSRLCPLYLVFISCQQGKLKVATSREVERNQLKVLLGGKKTELDWEGKSRFSTLWTTSVPCGSVVEVSLAETDSCLSLNITETRSVKANTFQFETPPSKAT